MSYSIECKEGHIGTPAPPSPVICDCIWENSTFCRFQQNGNFGIFSMYNASLLSMSIYNLL